MNNDILNSKLCGIVTALITPFTDNGQVDYYTMQSIVERQIASGIKIISPCGTTGESPTLSDDEYKKIIRLCVDICDNTDTFVVAGSGSNSTNRSVELSQIAEGEGADMLLVITPYYNKPSQEGMVAHYKYIHDHCSLPIILYNNPSRSCVDLYDDTIIDLSRDCDNIVAVKDASGCLERAKHLARCAPSDFKLFTGVDEVGFDFLYSGGHGIYSVISNLIPEIMVQIYNLIASGDEDGAKKYHEQIACLIGIMSMETNPIPIKTAMYLAGYCSNDHVRLPLLRASHLTTNSLKKKMERMQLLVESHAFN